MDKILSDEERIRRACEVVERRQNREPDYNRIRIKNTQSKTRGLLIQILICLLIYCGFYYIKNMPEGEQTNKWIKKTKEVLSYDVDFMGIYNKIINHEDVGDNKEENENNTDSNQNKISLLTENKFSNEDEYLGIGGELEEQAVDEIEFYNSEEELDEDIKYIKDNIKLISPVNGIITSRYGERDPSEIVSANHKGIDIGASTGTEIVSVCDGKVISVSSTGDFGKHIKIKHGDAIFIYAHCSKLFVNEGDEIKIGQKIAEVGSTGRATGPHLHFEIRRGERAIDPELIINFE
ncbi:MAG: M23 family metallopeptidase [Clostridia bacterium]|nr:M23 family metallopeptidase [Clostridia bacterium]